mgnify:CR=1 FL=1
MNISVVREPNPVPPVRSVVIVLTKEEAVELQRCIISVHITPLKYRLFDSLTQMFRVEGISGGYA